MDDTVSSTNRKHSASDPGRTTLPTRYVDSAIEQLPIRFENNQSMVVGSDRVRIYIPIQF